MGALFTVPHGEAIGRRVVVARTGAVGFAEDEGEVAVDKGGGGKEVGWGHITTFDTLT